MRLPTSAYLGGHGTRVAAHCRFADERIVTLVLESSEEAEPLPAGPRPRLPGLRRNLRSIFVEGFMASLMLGLGELYLGAYALAMGLGQVAAGLVSTVPLVGGAFLQLASPWAV